MDMDWLARQEDDNNEQEKVDKPFCHGEARQMICGEPSSHGEARLYTSKCFGLYTIQTYSSVGKCWPRDSCKHRPSVT
jgi:hypothetical protein